ncbi:hypothetical protein LMH87_005478 [Akanthomyces muscarius]|uniref:CENP-V/GFA domain-containing protein n=1 Tax=Akanthomyces muscarius TaxID=2231603 RepID=A0A9W8QLW7_AKAMU|nr:hypothetical protein LMH87_005478 [Akanthomyces muscarius]KAJ4163770.1 hypothetical protein LMH87_005478 [Akanthomyces muscarius]
MDARCHCGAVRFKTPLAAPLATYICHCDACKSLTSSAFAMSAIFPKFPLPASDVLSCYTRLTSTGATLYCYFCRNCGTRVVHSTDSKNVVSVRGGCVSGIDWTKAVHIWTKSAMVPIPESSESYSEESSDSSGQASAQQLLD